MINILFIHQSADLYGSDKTLLLLLTHIDRKKINPVVIIPLDGPLKAELEKIGVEVHITPVLKLYRDIVKPNNSLKFVSEYKTAITFLDQLNKKHHFDIIYSNTLAVSLGMFYAKKRKIQHIWHVHEIIVHPKIIATIFPKLLKRYADVIVANSETTLQNLIQREPEIKNKAVVIHNGIEPKNESYATLAKTDLGFDPGDLIITLIGRINRLKGHKLLLNAFIKNLSQQKKIKLLFVGSPVFGQENYLHEVEDIIRTNNLSESVKILPFTKNLNPIWQITDIAVMPSTEAESFGLVAVEAMLAQKPVIGSNHGGLTEIIVQDETGLLVKPNCEDDLTRAIQYLIDNPDKRSEMGIQGQKRAIAAFSINSYIQNFENLFERLK
ncbi:MAG: glycosyltransferase family 4 protein [Flavobacterium sp.]